MIITVSPALREQMGDYATDALERVLNYPIGADMILSVRERGLHRPAEIETAKHSMFPLLVIHDRALIDRAIDAVRGRWRVKLTTKFPKGHGDEYVTAIERV